MTEAADSYGTQHRRTVEEEARRLLADAEAKSKAQLDRAQAKVDELEHTVVARHETLQREAKMLEERKQRVLESLRDLAAQIQDALVEPSPEEGRADRRARRRAAQLISVSLRWHDVEPVTEYERHRNTAIFERQGNRNPLIDHPEWASRIDFSGPA